ncbi:glycoside hydrolase family 19 protein [Photobacterium nomapromontoriensis]|uniref:chitinase n=1 Tax=Photobacterium nomapromontoriensis TaxID=2910237 RepID=UPI003D0ED79A
MIRIQSLHLSSIALAILSSSAFAQSHEMTLSQLQQDEANVIASAPEGLQLVKDAIETLDNETVEAIQVNAVSNPQNVKRVERLVNQASWNEIFPERDEKYTYLNFLKAIGKYPAFCGTYSDGRDSDAICRKSLATMFAHFTQETGGHNPHSDNPEWQQGLFYLREVGWEEGTAGGYGVCDPSLWQAQAYPCGTFADGSYKSYFGRGSKQLSYNYNYGPFSQSIYGNVDKLLNEPELVADTWLNLASAVFFYLYPQPPKPSMLHVIDGTWQPNERDLANGLVPGFGVTTQIINGGVECGGSSEHKQSQNRIDYYRNFANYLGVPIAENEVLGCADMKQFDDGGAGALSIYWEQDWGWTPDTPSGATYKCQLVAYQGPFSAFIEGDYRQCVEKYFDVTIIDDTEGAAPQANAGADIELIANNDVVVLDGSRSTSAANDVLSYQWTSVDGSLTIQSANQAVAQVTVPAVDAITQYRFVLTVTNQDAETSSDEMVVTAKPMPANFPPVIAINGEDTVNSGQDLTLTLDIQDVDDSNFTVTWSNDKNLTMVVTGNDRSMTLTAPTVDADQVVNVHVNVIDGGNNSVDSAKTISVKAQEQGATTWNKDTVYTEGNTVIYNGVTYTAKWWTTGDIPGQSDVWQAQDSGAVAEWSATKAYDGGNKVTRKGTTYKAKWWTKGDKPESAGSPWEQI